MNMLVIMLAFAGAITAFAGEKQGMGRLNNVQFQWTATEAKTGLVEISFDKAVWLHAAQLQFLRHLPAGPIVRVDNVTTGELTKLTLALNGSFDEALAQADRAIPGLTLRTVPKPEEQAKPAFPPVAIVQ
jgi:hypothetical protein